MASRPEQVTVRDTVVRYFHQRAPVDQVQQAVLEAGRSMQADGMTMEDILVTLKGAVRLAADHVNQPSTPERAAWLRTQITPWLVSLYIGNGEEPADDV
ncbi:MAG TPA: hypothetical protein VLI40_14095 [Gemmatimonadaceae bacterium]|nr:hypothetical protein [Gemmatimonadaceae bacterium]